MLFDLKGKRKRLVQVVYVGLAILFGGGLVLFGVGGNVSGGLIDAFKGSGSGRHQRLQRPGRSAPSAERRANPREPEAWLAVVRAQFNLASSPEGSDAETGPLTDRGQQAIIEVAQAWERYLRLKPEEDRRERRRLRRPRLRRAPGLRQGRRDAGALGEGTARARTAISSSPTSPTARGRSRRATRRPRKPSGARRRDQRNTVRSLIKDTKKQGAQFAKALEEAKKAERQQQKAGGEGGQGAQPGQSFGPLPGTGATGGGGASP